MKFLMAGWDSDGGVEAVQTVVRKAVRRGHEVRVPGTEGLRGVLDLSGGLPGHVADLAPHASAGRIHVFHLT